jgi:RNA polymerase sigma-70 factor (ECF subfamily)
LSELQARLTEALDQLSPEHRAVVTLFDVQGVPHAEIARVMGVSEGTVRSRLFYAHRQLQSLLSDMADEFLPAASAQAAS